MPALPSCRRAILLGMIIFCQGCAHGPADRWCFVESGTESLRLGIPWEEVRGIYGVTAGFEGGGHGLSYAYEDDRGRGCLVFGVQDGCVETLVLRETRRASPRGRVVLLREGDLRTSRGLSLGDPQGKVERVLGLPHEVRREGNRLTYSYHATVEECPRVGCCYDGFYGFEDGRLVEIRLHDGC